MKLLWMFFVTFLSPIPIIDGAKILFISPNLINSMIMYTGRMADVLVRAGHDVTFFIPEISRNNMMNGTKLAKIVRMKDLGGNWDQRMATNFADIFAAYTPSFWRRRTDIMVMNDVCEAILQRIDELSEFRNFDLAISDNIDFCDSALPLALGIKKYIWTSTGPVHDSNVWAMGIPPEAAYVPTLWENPIPPQMSVMDKLSNLIQTYLNRFLMWERAAAVTRLFRRYVRSDFPDVVEVAASSAALFVNSDEFVEPARPVPPKVVYVGGVGLAKPAVPPKEFAEFIGPSSPPFVIFSLGTAAPTRSIRAPHKLNIFSAFKHFPNIIFIVKVDKGDAEAELMASTIPNVRLYSWLPQRDLLALPSARLLITHGGYNSVFEGAISGVPMLVLPLFFDQHRNAHGLEYKGVARQISPPELTEELMVRELKTLLEDPSYKARAQRLAFLHQNKPNQPDETVRQWVDFILKAGPLPELDPHGLQLRWYEHWYLDALWMALFLGLVALLLFPAADGAKILFVSPNLSNSMVMYTGRMADVLVRAGHNVTFFIPEMSSTNLMNGTKLAKIVRMKDLGGHWDRLMGSNYGDAFAPFVPSFWRRRRELLAMHDVCEAILQRFDDLSELRDFDLAITDNVDFCDSGIPTALGIPKQLWTTTGSLHDANVWTMGVPLESAYVPTLWENPNGPKMGIPDRLSNLIQTTLNRLLIWERAIAVTRLFRRYVRPDFPDVVEAVSKSAVLFVNSDEFVEPARPVPPKVVYIGGVGLAEPKLPTGEFAKFAQPNAPPFVIFSLGTAASTRNIRPQQKLGLFRAFQRFPNITFIVKMDHEDLEAQRIAATIPNVQLVGWIPQRDLLALPSARLLITHGGYNSVFESAISGVPMLVLPLFFDQHRNAHGLEYRGVARQLDPNRLTEEILVAELKVLLGDPSYKRRAERLAFLHKNKPNQPDETLRRWVDFVLAAGPLPELDPHGRLLHCYEHWFLDALAAIVFAAVVGNWLGKRIWALGMGVVQRRVKSKIE